MVRSAPTISSRLLAFAALATLLVVPALHGPLAHAHVPSAGSASLDAEAAPADGPHAGVTEVCPLCLAASQSRTVLAAPPDVATDTPFDGPPCTFAAALLAHAPVDLTRAAPRAPPALA